MSGKLGVGAWAGLGSILGLLAGSMVGAAISGNGRKGAAAAVLPALAGTALGAFAGAALSAAEPNTTTVTTTTTGAGRIPAGVGAAPIGLSDVPHKCTARSATAIAQQLPGAPWIYESSAPKGAQISLPKVTTTGSSRVDEYDVVTPMGAKRIPVRRIHIEGERNRIVLTCPTTAEQFVFVQAAS